MWAYELWTPIWPNAVVDISTVVDRKKAAIALYESQMEDRDYAAAILGLNAYRGLPFRLPFAEGFYTAPAPDFAGLARRLRLLS